MDPRRAVRRPATAEAMALHHSLESAPLRPAGHLDAGADLERLDGHLLADRRSAVLRHGELAQDRRSSLEPGLRRVPSLRLRRTALLASAEPELDRLVAGLLRRPNRNDGTRPRFDDRNR